MHFLLGYALAGDRDFLEREEDFIQQLDDGDLLAVQEGYAMWLSDPMYF